MLITAEDWPIKRNNLYGHLGLQQDPQELPGPILAHLDQHLDLLDRAVDKDKVLIDTTVHLDPLEAQVGDVEADRLRRAIFEAHPPGQLPEIILEIDNATRFSWILLGREDPRQILAYRVPRKVSNALTAQYDRVMYLLNDMPVSRALMHEYVEVVD
jgi:hypothetical protein